MNIEQLYAYLDGELTPEEAARVESALAADPALAAQLAELSSVDDLLGTLPGVTTSAGFTADVLHRARRRRRAGRIVRLLAPLAAAAAVVVGLVFLTRAAEDPSGDVFTPDDYALYTWEADAETYGSLALDDLEDEILKELGAT